MQADLQQYTMALQGGDAATGRLPEQIQRDVQRAVQDARAAAHEGRAQVPAPSAPSAPLPLDHPVTIHKNGKTITIGPSGINVQEAMPGTAVPPAMPPGDGIPSGVVVISLAFFVMLAVIAIGWPIARAIAKRLDRNAGAPKIPAEVTEQLRRLEQAVDTIAVEVERISEGQRFSSRLLAELQPMVQRAQEAQPLLARPGAPDGR